MTPFWENLNWEPLRITIRVLCGGEGGGEGEGEGGEGGEGGGGGVADGRFILSL